MSGFVDELERRITDARAALRVAREAGEFYAAHTCTGELGCLYRLANDNGAPIPACEAKTFPSIQ